MADAIQPIEHYILSGLQRRIWEVFGLRCDYKYSTDPLLQSDGTRKPTYPYSYLRFNSISHRKEDLPHGIETRWHYGGSSDDGNAVNAYRLVGAKFHIDFVLLSNSLAPIEKILNAWMFSYRFTGLNYRVIYDGIRVDIKVLLGSQIDGPQMDQGLDEPIEFQFQAPIEVWGYMSQAVEKRVEVIRSLDLRFRMNGDTAEYTVSDDQNLVEWQDPNVPVSQDDQRALQDVEDAAKIRLPGSL